MRVVVADASSLILTAKCEVLRPYASRVELLVPREVVQEIATPELQERHPDAVSIATAIEQGWLRVLTVRSRRKLPLTLGVGEAAAIRLFGQERADSLLSDDGRAIRTCRLLAIPFTTTPRVVVDLHAVGALPTVRARKALEKLAVVGRYRREIIAAALVALQEK